MNNRNSITNLKYNIILWLNRPINKTEIMFDVVVNLFEEIMSELIDNKLKLRQEENVLLMNFIYFLYCFSDTDTKTI